MLLFASQAGYYLYYTLQLQTARSEVKEKLESNLVQTSLELIIQEDNDLIWQEYGKEFYKGGQLYDVARKEVLDGKTLLYCLADGKEQNLVEDLSLLLKSGTESTNDRKATRDTFKFQLSDYILQSVEKNFISTHEHLRLFPSNDIAIFSFPLVVEGPPPRA